MRGAVQDAVDAFEPVAGEPLAQRLDDRDAAGDRRLERERQPRRLGPRREPRAVMRHQRLVGGDDVLAVIERGIDDLAGDPVGAADQFDDDVDLGIGGHRRRILVPAHRRQIDAAVAAAVARRHRGDDDRAAAAFGQELGLVLQQFEDAGPDRAETGDGNLQGRLHDPGNPDETAATMPGQIRPAPAWAPQPCFSVRGPEFR